MKKSAVIILMVALFSGSAFASGPACKFADKSGLTSNTTVKTASAVQPVAGESKK